jgi:uncharacterized protein
MECWKMNKNLKLSKYNVFSKLKDSPDYFILNLLSGNADILSPEKAKEIRTGQFTDIDEYIEKGYLVDETEESKRYKLKYLDFLDRREEEEVQIFFVPRYACNFSCSYCYQSDYEPPQNPLEKKVVDAFYRYIDNHFPWKKKYITIFGGEPLMDGKRAKKELLWLLQGAAERGLEVAIVTNGYLLADYMEVLKTAAIREIQVTLDGTQEMHDSRRFLKNGAATFQTITAGIDAALANRMPVNLRVVVDKGNIGNLEEIAAFAIEKGWTRHPLFKTQLGRNYDLHTCGVDKERLFSRVGLYEALYKVIKDHPEFLEFHRPAFSVSRFLFENGELPDPLFDSCPGTKTEWAFDYSGHIYACTATVGKKGEELGTFYPQVTRQEDAIEAWEERDVTSIPACKDCPVQLACGGGCAAVARNNTGNIENRDCRPIRELLEMGISLYF